MNTEKGKSFLRRIIFLLHKDGKVWLCIQKIYQCLYQLALVQFRLPKTLAPVFRTGLKTKALKRSAFLCLSFKSDLQNRSLKAKYTHR